MGSLRPLRSPSPANLVRLVLALTLATVVSPRIASQSPGDLPVALLVPLTGPSPAHGVSARDGALLAIEEWNARGGVNAAPSAGAARVPRKIRAIVKDSQCNRDAGLAAVADVVAHSRTRYVIGDVCSSASVAVAEFVNARGIIQVTPTSTNPSVTVDEQGKTRPYSFRVCFTDDFQGILAARVALERMKARTAFIMTDPTNTYVRSVAESFRAAFAKMGGTIAGEEKYSARRSDYSPLLARIRAARPDVAFLPDAYFVVNAVTGQAHEQGVRTPFLGSEGWNSPDLDGWSADGGFYVDHFSADDPRAVVAAFRKAFGARYKDRDGRARVPDAVAALSYDAANLLLRAISDAGVDDPRAVRNALERIRYEGVTGLIRFDSRHGAVKGGAVLAVRGGRVKFDSHIEPPAYVEAGAPAAPPSR